MERNKQKRLYIGDLPGAKEIGANTMSEYLGQRIGRATLFFNNTDQTSFNLTTIDFSTSKDADKIVQEIIYCLIPRFSSTLRKQSKDLPNGKRQIQTVGFKMGNYSETDISLKMFTDETVDGKNKRKKVVTFELEKTVDLSIDRFMNSL